MNPRSAQGTQAGTGTRFLLFPQAPVLSAIGPPETVWIDAPPGSIGPGPSDDRMYVVDAIGKRRHYEYPDLPPWRGAAAAPAQPGPTGHFDHVAPPSREFMAAHMYGTLRFVRDIWERYFGGPVRWHFAAHFPRLELIPLIEWDNAHCGYGFLETGFAYPDAPERAPFCLNFDVLAHELGHAFVYGLLGTPPPERVTATYHAFHESAADCVAMIAVLHFDSVVDRLLEATRGNLYLPNELNRIGELSETAQIRLASQSLTLADVPDLDTPVGRLTQPERHALSLPLTGAVFDILVDVFQALLVQDGLIDAALDRASRRDAPAADDAMVQAAFDQRYAGRHAAFKSVLIDARDYVGRLLAHAWTMLSWDLSYRQLAGTLLAADARRFGGAGRNIIIDSLAWRGIDFPFRLGRRVFHEQVTRARGSR